MWVGCPTTPPTHVGTWTGLVAGNLIRKNKGCAGAMLTCGVGVSGERGPQWVRSRVSGPCGVQQIPPSQEYRLSPRFPAS